MATPDQVRMQQEARDKYTKFFMIDYLEFNLRKLVIENTDLCATNCGLFSDLMKDEAMKP